MRKIPTAPAVGIFLRLCVQFILLPSNGVFLYVFQMFVIVLLVADDVVVVIPLPDIMTVFLIAETLECGNKPRHRRVLSRRGRRPRRPILRYHQQQMNMIGHNHISIDTNITVKIVKLLDVFIRNFAMRQQIDAIGGVEDVAPYNG